MQWRSNFFHIYTVQQSRLLCNDEALFSRVYRSIVEVNMRWWSRFFTSIHSNSQNHIPTLYKKRWRKNEKTVLEIATSCKLFEMFTQNGKKPSSIRQLLYSKGYFQRFIQSFLVFLNLQIFAIDFVFYPFPEFMLTSKRLANRLF